MIFKQFPGVLELKKISRDDIILHIYYRDKNLTSREDINKATYGFWILAFSFYGTPVFGVI